MLTQPATATAPAPRIIFNLESLLIDSLAGVRHALNAVARTRRSVWLHPLTHDDLRSRCLADFLSEIAGSDDPALIAELIEQYRQIYEKESRYRAPLLPDAENLIELLSGMGAELHYVSTWGPEVSTQLVRRHGLSRHLSTVYTPPISICPCARAGLFENFIAAHEHPADSYLLLSDSLPELHTAARLGVPAVGLAYGQTPAQTLWSAKSLLGVACSPADLGHWLLAHTAAQKCLRSASQRLATTLH